MSSFNARLRLPGRSKLPLGVEVDISHERMTLTSEERTVAAWPLEKLEVDAMADGFHIKVDGDDFVLSVADSKRFAAEVGMDRRPSQTPSSPTGLSPTENHDKGLRATVAETTSDQEHPDDFLARISDVAKLLTSDSVTPAAAFGQWLSLLKEINRRHGQGSMPTDEYYRLNTQLLHLIPEPAPIPLRHVT